MSRRHTWSSATVAAEAEREVTRQAIAAWLAVWTAFGFADYLIHKRGRTTLSKAGRRLFRTQTPAGRAVFTAAYFGSAYVLWHHVTNEGGPQR